MIQLTLLALTLLLILYRKKVFNNIFSATFPFWRNHQKLGEFFGVRYVVSNEWETTRKTSGLNLVTIPGQKHLNGFDAHLGDFEFIKSFRKRQRTPVADFEIVLKKGRRSFAELESEVIALWHNELVRCYELPMMENEFMIERSTINRKKTAERGTFGLFGRIYDLFWGERFESRKQRDAMSKLTDEEKLLYFVPFLTTIDTFMLCLAYKSYGEDLSDFFDRVPVKYVPMYDGDTPVICTLVNNKVNNPGNAVFGPKGVVCPGSNVTTQILKSIRDFCNTADWDIEGVPAQSDKAIAGLINLDQLFITIK